MVSKRLRTGIRIESEHASTIKLIKNFVKKNGKFPSNRFIFMNIAKNHLEEDKDYYKKLKKMERE